MHPDAGSASHVASYDHLRVCDHLFLWKAGLITRLFGHQLFDIYGFNGLLLGYVIYTLPVSFMLILNTMGYVDKKFMVVSRVMGDKPLAGFWQTVIRPLLGNAGCFPRSVFLSVLYGLRDPGFCGWKIRSGSNGSLQ